MTRQQKLRAPIYSKDYTKRCSSKKEKKMIADGELKIQEEIKSDING